MFIIIKLIIVILNIKNSNKIIIKNKILVYNNFLNLVIIKFCSDIYEFLMIK